MIYLENYLGRLTYKRLSARYKCFSIIIPCILLLLLRYLQLFHSIGKLEYTIYSPCIIHCLLSGIPTLISTYVLLISMFSSKKKVKKLLKTLRQNKLIKFMCSEFFFRELTSELKK